MRPNGTTFRFGGAVFAAGAGIVITALAVFVIMNLAFAWLFIRNVAATPDMLAVPLILFLLGLLLMGIGSFVRAYARQKGAYYERQLRKPRQR
jgi:uncharacterized membrane protein YczE